MDSSVGSYRGSAGSIPDFVDSCYHIGDIEDCPEIQPRCLSIQVPVLKSGYYSASRFLLVGLVRVRRLVVGLVAVDSGMEVKEVPLPSFPQLKRNLFKFYV